MYSVVRPLLFCLPAETAHHFTLVGLKALHRLRLSPCLSHAAQPKTVFGLTFKNPVGLAAGLDKNGDYIDALAALGFGFIEVGTVTPRPQSGNPKPRLFRIPEQDALINRMGFNNRGIDYLIERVAKSKYEGILGINIGKNATTPIENALDDYVICLKKAYAHASYITVNISSPNTAGLRQLQQGTFLEQLLEGLKTEQAKLKVQYQKQVPLLVKVAPDLTEEEITHLAAAFLRYEIEGVIATNTTLERESVKAYPAAQESGGLSGRPVFQKSTAILQQFYRELKGKIPLIGVGGITRREEAEAKFAAGAELIQIYTGLVYQGPRLIRNCLH